METKETKHTPRPWYERTQAIITLEDGHNETVSEIGIIATDETIAYVTNVQYQPLIEAAPDLLAACEMGLKLAQMLNHPYEYHIEAAIAKAKANT